MNKSHKIWTGIFLIMFVVPEIFFSFIISFFASLNGIENFPFLYEYFVNPQFFIDKPIFLFSFLIVEFFGVLGLLIWNIKFNNQRYKIILTLLLILILVLLAIVFFVGYSVMNINFP